MIKMQNKKNEEKIAELQSFISRFSANKSKSRQATARRKLLDKLTVEELPASSRRYPFIGFDMDRLPGKEILFVDSLTKSVDGKLLFKDLTFRLSKDDKVAFLGNELAVTNLFRILMEETEADSGEFKFGVSITTSYFPHDNTPYFEGCNDSILDWMRQYSKDQTETYLRGFLGKMLFSNEAVFKPVNVLSGGEKVRCMLSRMMMFGSNMLIIDQPTDHLDLESITAVNNGMQSFKGNILFSSHDYELVNTVANRIIEILPDGGCRDFLGTYDEYVARKKAEAEAENV
jgi:ATPase subunit of ABC transporter with duplicated ATPase domains